MCMKQFRKVLSLALCMVLTLTCVPVGLAEGTNTITKDDLADMVPNFYDVYTNQWLYFGWENQDHKSLSTMGGALFSGGANPGKGVRYETWDDTQNKYVVYDLKAKPFCYTVTVGGTEYVPDETSENRRQNTKWYQADGYMNSPVSEWKAGDTGIDVKIQHVVNNVKVTRANKNAGVTFSQVTLSNTASVDQTVVLNVSARSIYEVPMNGVTPDYEVVIKERTSSEMEEGYAQYLVTVPAGGSKKLDFAATVWNYPRPDDMKAMDGFDKQYAAVKAHYDALLADMTLPVSLPDAEMTNSYLNSMIVMWETMVKSTWNGDWEAGTAAAQANPDDIPILKSYNGQADYQIRGSAATQAKALNGNGFMHGYDVYFPHDVPNMVEQFVRDGRLELAMNIMNSPNYQTLYLPSKHGGNLDAIPKYIIPYATLWQAMSDEQRAEYFTDDVKARIKQVATVEIPKYIIPEGEEYAGLIQKSESLDNMPYDYLITDNFTALHGLVSYKYLCEAWGWEDQVAWADTTMTNLNNALNRCMDDFMERNGTEWYMCAMNDDSGFWKRHLNGSVLYDGNFICSSLMMSTFPWDAVLRGYDLGGTWSDYFEASLDNAMELKAKCDNIPDGSWGAWWGHEYGTVYNVGQSVPMLYSDKYRTAVVTAYEWLMKNQTAPFQWAESFDPGQNADDWTTAAIDYETWGLGFLRQGLLEATASVKTDGTVIIGRGIPNEWMVSPTPIEWQNIQINDGRKFDTLKLYSPSATTVKLELTGDDATNDIVLDLAALKNNIASVSVGTFDNEAGTVTIPANTKELTVTLKNRIAVEESIEIPDNVTATADGKDIILNWNEVEDAQSYIVKVTAGGETMAIEQVDDNTYRLEDAVPGLTYSFYVNSVGTVEESVFSDPVTAITTHPTDTPSGDGSITVTTTNLANGSTQNLTQLGTLDWLKTGYGTRGQNDVIERKNQDTAYLHRFYFPARNNNDILWNNDIGYTYSWSDGTHTAAGSDKIALNMGAYFGQPSITEEATVLMVTAPATDKDGNTLLVDIGTWQATARIDIFLSDNSAPVQTFRITPQATAKYDRYAITYKVPEGSNASIVVTATIEAKSHQAANIILPAAMLQGDPITLDSLTIKAPDKTEYMVGDALDLTGLNVTANYTYGESKKVTDYTVTGYDASKAGEQTVTVSYTEKGITKTAEFTVKVETAELVSITVTPPAKVSYVVGESFEHSGMNVTAHYANRPDKGITDYTITGYDMNKVGNQTVTVSYTEGDITKTATFVISVANEKQVLTGLTVESSVKAYRVGDAFDQSTLTVTAQYQDGSSKPVNQYTLSTIDTATKGAKLITVTYIEEGVIKTALLTVTVVLPGDVDDNNQVTANDALMALQAATGKVALTEAESLAAEVDGDKDGKVTANDALLILQLATKKIGTFPIAN